MWWQNISWNQHNKYTICESDHRKEASRKGKSRVLVLTSPRRLYSGNTSGPHWNINICFYTNWGWNKSENTVPKYHVVYHGDIPASCRYISTRIRMVLQTNYKSNLFSTVVLHSLTWRCSLQLQVRLMNIACNFKLINVEGPLKKWLYFYFVCKISLTSIPNHTVFSKEWREQNTGQDWVKPLYEKTFASMVDRRSFWTLINRSKT